MEVPDDVEMAGKLPFQFVAEDGQRHLRSVFCKDRRVAGQYMAHDLSAYMAIEQGMIEPVAEATQASIARGIALFRAGFENYERSLKQLKAA